MDDDVLDFEVCRLIPLLILFQLCSDYISIVFAKLFGLRFALYL